MKSILSPLVAAWLAAFLFTACSTKKDDPAPPVAPNNGSATLIVDGTTIPVRMVDANNNLGTLSFGITGTGGEKIILYIYNFTGVATAGPLGGAAGNSSLIYYVPNSTGSAATYPTWYTPPTPIGGTGTFRVTPVGTVPVRVLGTFSCTAHPYSTANGTTATGTRVISGTFTDVPY